jgi:hypothetical protein
MSATPTAITSDIIDIIDKTDVEVKKDIDVVVRLPLEQMAEMKSKGAESFDIGLIWDAGMEISVVAKTDFLKDLSKSRPEMMKAWAAHMEVTVEELLEMKEVPLWVVDAAMFDIVYGNPDQKMAEMDMKEDIKFGTMDKIVKMNAAYGEQVKQLALKLKASSAGSTDLPDFATTIGSSVECKHGDPQLTYASTFVIPLKVSGTEAKRIQAGEGLLISFTEADAKQWVRENVLAVERRNLEFLEDEDISSLTPQELAELLVRKSNESIEVYKKRKADAAGESQSGSKRQKV